MASITISDTIFFSYATVAEADEYLIPDANFSVWDALTDDQKGKYLVQATRLLDSLNYSTVADTQVKRTLLDNIVSACILIANLLSTGTTDILGASATGAEQKRLKAGSVEIENFRSFSVSKFDTWPENILSLIRQYLGINALGYYGAASFGTDGTMPTTDYSLINNV